MLLQVRSTLWRASRNALLETLRSVLRTCKSTGAGPLADGANKRQVVDNRQLRSIISPLLQLQEGADPHSPLCNLDARRKPKSGVFYIEGETMGVDSVPLSPIDVDSALPANACTSQIRHHADSRSIRYSWDTDTLVGWQINHDLVMWCLCKHSDERMIRTKSPHI